MASRKLPPEAQRIFDKYTVGFVRRLKKEDAVKMFKEEFKLTEQQADVVFDIFDKDKNEILSQWEYGLFYMTVGQSIDEIFKGFQELEVENSGFVDIDKTWDYLKKVKTTSGDVIPDENLEMIIKTAAGEERSVDIRKFINVYCRVKQHKGESENKEGTS